MYNWLLFDSSNECGAIIFLPAPFRGNLLVILFCALQLCSLICRNLDSFTVIVAMLICNVKSLRCCDMWMFLWGSRVSVVKHHLLRCLLKGVYPPLAGGIRPPYSDWVTVSLLLTGGKPSHIWHKQTLYDFKFEWNECFKSESLSEACSHCSFQSVLWSERVNCSDVDGCSRQSC